MKLKKFIFIANIILFIVLLAMIGAIVKFLLTYPPTSTCKSEVTIKVVPVPVEVSDEDINVEPDESSYISEPEIEESSSVKVSVEESVEESVDLAYSYTEEDLDLLARLINAEGGVESYETKLKIGSVVMNRVDDPAFPNTIQEVIYQENQFSVTTHKKDGVYMIDLPADEDSIKAATEILTCGSVLPPKVQVFYHKSIITGWVASREPYGTFDRTTFAYIYKKGEQ